MINKRDAVFGNAGGGKFAAAAVKDRCTVLHAGDTVRPAGLGDREAATPGAQLFAELKR